MNANVAQLLLVLTAGIGGILALQARLRRSDARSRDRRSVRLGGRVMWPDGWNG